MSDAKEWDEYISGTTEIDTKSSWMQDLEKLVKQIPKENVRKILEIGCSAGRILRWVTGIIPAEPYGIDLNDSGKDKVKHFKKGDARAIPHKDDAFGLTMSMGLLEHFDNHEDRDKAIAEQVRVTRKGGYVLITTPTLIRSSLMYWYTKLITDRKNDFKHYAISKGDVARVLRENGVEIVKAHYAGWFFEPKGVPKLFTLSQTSQVMLILGRKRPNKESRT